MRYFTLGAILWCVTCAAAGAQAPDPQVMAPIQKFVDSFNKGDTAGAAATHTAGADLAIVDEVPPYLWRGAKAFQDWSAALDSDIKKQGMTDSMVALEKPTRTEMDGGRAYVVVPAVYTFKQRGVAMREAAQMTFTLQKEAAGWMIHSWTWTGPKPQKAPITR
jgi:hypothetical protein